MATAPNARTRQVGDAAIVVLADQGARGLTHRAVDRAAGLPPGTTSNHARTRAALLTLALARIAELEAAETGASASETFEPGYSGSEISGSGQSGSGLSGSGQSGSGQSGSGQSGSGLSGLGVSGEELADALATVLDRWITDPGARRRVLARFELALEATRRPELRAAYDKVGRVIRGQAVQLLAIGGSADPERDAWTLIAWMEGTVFYALAGAGAAVSPALDGLRDQLGRLLATMIPVARPPAGHDDSGAA